VREAIEKEAKIFYSNKSESSVEQAMGETPSDYNKENMRFEGKSTGLPRGTLQNQLPNTPLSHLQDHALPKESQTNKHLTQPHLSDLPLGQDQFSQQDPPPLPSQ